MDTPPVQVLQADYRNPLHAAALVELLDHYAQDRMGGAEPLSTNARHHLVGELARRPHAFSVLAFVDGQAVGLVNCFEGFSTFACQPLVNVHDVAVREDMRGRGISRLMLEKVEAIARERGCCKLTLEVLEGNAPAQAAYRKLGYGAYELDPTLGKALFWQKVLA